MPLQIAIGKQLKSILDLDDNTKIGYTVHVSSFTQTFRLLE